MEHRDAFNRYAGFALAKLDDPITHVTLVPSKIVEELGEEPSKGNIGRCERTLDWLFENGYFHCSSRSYSGNPTIAEKAFRDARLTTAGFAALNVKINFRGKADGPAMFCWSRLRASQARRELQPSAKLSGK